jgi:indolepyruvate ferredoxin oxidoreductase, alpha subunit
MAEGSFARDVQQLRVGAAAQFRGEGIAAITKALLENRVGYFADYQGGADFPPMDRCGSSFGNVGNLSGPGRGDVQESRWGPMLPSTRCRICPPAG